MHKHSPITFHHANINKKTTSESKIFFFIANYKTFPNSLAQSAGGLWPGVEYTPG